MGTGLLEPTHRADASPCQTSADCLFLVIVDRDHPDVFARLSTAFAGDPTALVMWDRRAAVARSTDSRTDATRTHDRRVPVADSWSVVHFAVTLQTDDLASGPV